MMEHTQFKLKCMSCGLHFVVCSWDPGWPGEGKAAYCPECGKQMCLPLAASFVQRPIFEVVPGIPKIPGGI